MAAEPYPTTDVQLTIPLRVTLSSKSGSKNAHRAVQTYRVFREILKLRPGGLTEMLGAWSLSLSAESGGVEGSYKRSRSWKTHELLALRIIKATDEAPNWRLAAAILNAYFFDGDDIRTGATVKRKVEGGLTAKED